MDCDESGTESDEISRAQRYGDASVVLEDVLLAGVGGELWERNVVGKWRTIVEEAALAHWLEQLVLKIRLAAFERLSKAVGRQQAWMLGYCRRPGE